MPCFKCLASKARLHSTERQAEPIGNVCPVRRSLLWPVGNLGETVGYRVIETRDSTSPSGASRAGQRSLYELTRASRWLSRSPRAARRDYRPSPRLATRGSSARTAPEAQFRASPSAAGYALT